MSQVEGYFLGRRLVMRLHADVHMVKRYSQIGMSKEDRNELIEMINTHLLETENAWEI